jgi:hypothetical protein
MRINFNNSSRPLSAAKLLARRTGHVRLSAAQEAIAKAAGYRDWHDLHRSSGGPSSHDPVTPDRAKALVLSVVDALDVSLGEAQYALSRARMFTFSLEENLQLRASLWRERLFGCAARGKVGTLVMVQALRGKEVGYLKPGGEGYDQLLYDSGFGSCASSEVSYPRGTTEDFAPSVLWLPYGYWKRAKGEMVAFSRDYRPLWHIGSGKVVPADPWEWIGDIREEFFFREIAGTGTWSYGRARELALAFLAENRISETPRLLDAMPFLFEPGEVTVKGAVERLKANATQLAA